jgi:hypothetical protein
MSGTVGMLSALKAFNEKNTGTFYPDLYKLKLQTLNAGKKTLSNFVYTFTVTESTIGEAISSSSSSSATNEYLKMLVEFRRLFPDLEFYCTKASSANQPEDLSKFFPYPLTEPAAPETFQELENSQLFYISVPLLKSEEQPGIIGTGTTWLV